jgi:hypothetical protein
MTDMSNHARTEEHGWQLAVGAPAIALVVLVLLGYGIAGSYESLSHLAEVNHVPLWRFAPIGMDGGLVGVIIMDITLTWMGRSIGWLRQTARLFALGTVVANAWAGWPDPVGVFFRISAPLLIVIISEAVRTVLLRRARGSEQDPVPFARWLLDFRGTWRLWRRMKLWRITSYTAAIDMELSRLHAIAQLSGKFGAGWQEKVPPGLAWMLTAGVRMDEALKSVAELTAPPADGASQRTAIANTPRRSPAKRKKGSRASSAAKAGAPDLSMQAEALAILGAQPGISGTELGRRLGCTPRYGQILKSSLSGAPATGPIERVQQ